jgi:pSer/pThr/pTyr-binding forkhead associated (FHA) protein
MPFFLKVLSSPNKEKIGTKIELKEGDSIAGRVSPPASICLNGVKVSKTHCVFHVDGTQLKISDLSSTNGVFVNGKRLDNANLKEKDRLVIGDFVLEVSASGPGKSSDKKKVPPRPSTKKSETKA